MSTSATPPSLNRGTGQTKQPLIHEHLGYSPKLKSLQDLSIKFEAMVTEEVVDDAGL
jgi:hypothetical protein